MGHTYQLLALHAGRAQNTSVVTKEEKAGGQLCGIS